MSRFMAGHVDISMAVLDRLAKLLDMAITVGPNAAKPSDFPDARRKDRRNK